MRFTSTVASSRDVRRATSEQEVNLTRVAPENLDWLARQVWVTEIRPARDDDGQGDSGGHGAAGPWVTLITLVAAPTWEQQVQARRRTGPTWRVSGRGVGGLRR